MIIGIPKERKTLEKRVAMIPDGVAELVEEGHQVLVEQGAGEGSFYADEEYQNAGAKLLPSLEKIWSSSELLLKVKEPAPEEYKYFRKDLIIFDYLHLAGVPKVAEELLAAETTSIAYELVQLDDGSLPLLEPMSEIAGKLAAQVSSYFLLTQQGGKGLLFGGLGSVDPAQVTVIGAGIAGCAAIEVAHGMGAEVHVVDISSRALARVKAKYSERLQVHLSDSDTIMEICRKSDVVILAVLVPGARAPKVLLKEHVDAMHAGSVLIDVSIDQGGAAETIHPTDLEEPTYLESDVVHYAVPNMPSQVAHTATKALTQVTLPYVKQIARLGFKQAVQNSAALKNAVNTYQGFVCNQNVAAALGKEYVELSKRL